MTSLVILFKSISRKSQRTMARSKWMICRMHLVFYRIQIGRVKKHKWMCTWSKKRRTRPSPGENKSIMYFSVAVRLRRNYSLKTIAIDNLLVLFFHIVSIVSFRRKIVYSFRFNIDRIEWTHSIVGWISESESASLSWWKNDSAR